MDEEQSAADLPLFEDPVLQRRFDELNERRGRYLNVAVIIEQTIDDILFDLFDIELDRVDAFRRAFLHDRVTMGTRVTMLRFGLEAAGLLDQNAALLAQLNEVVGWRNRWAHAATSFTAADAQIAGPVPFTMRRYVAEPLTIEPAEAQAAQLTAQAAAGAVRLLFFEVRGVYQSRHPADP